MPSILVPLDGSALAERVLPCVQYLATLLAAQVQLLRVVSNADEEALLVHQDLLLARSVAWHSPSAPVCGVPGSS